MVKGFEATLLDGGNSFKEFKGNASDLRNIEPALEPAFLKLMDIFHNMTDETKKMALAHQLFGRGVSQDLVAAMSVGSKAFLEFREAQKEAGLALTENDEHIAKDFHKSLNQLQGDLKVTAEQIGNLFAPGFTAGFNILDEAIRKSHPELLKFASDIANQVKPIITDLFRLLAGEEPKITWILVIQQALSNLGSFITSSVKPVIGDLLRLLAGQQVQTPWVRTVVELLNSLGSTIKGIVIPAFELLIGFIDKIKNTINDAFGTNLSKMDVVFLYALGRMTGALGLLGSLLLLVPGWITAAFVIGAGIYLFWDKIVEVATAAFEKIKAKVLELRNYMAETLGTSAADVILAGLGTALLAGIALIGTRMAIGLATAFVTALVGLPGLAEAAIGVVGLAIAAALVTAIIKGMQLLSNKTAPKPLGSAGPANPDEDGEKVPLPKSRPGSAPAADKSVTEQLKALVADHEASIKSAVTGTHELAAATHDAAEKIKGATDKLKGSEFSKDKGTIRTNPFFDNPNAQGDVVTGGPGLIKNNPFFQPPPTPTSSDKKTEANASLEEFSAGLKKVNPELEKTGTDLNTTDTAFSKASTDVATAETSLKTTTDTADTSVESLGTQAGVTTEALLGLDGKWTGLGDTLDSVTGKLKDFLDALDKKSGDSGTSSSAPDSSSDDGPSPVAGKAAGGPFGVPGTRPAIALMRSCLMVSLSCKQSPLKNTDNPSCMQLMRVSSIWVVWYKA
jgi:hypothetical protein